MSDSGFEPNNFAGSDRGPGMTRGGPPPPPLPGVAQPNMGQAMHRPAPPMFRRPHQQNNHYPLQYGRSMSPVSPVSPVPPVPKKRSTHEISDIRDEFRTQKDCRDRLTDYFVFRIEPVDGEEVYTEEGDPVKPTWMNAHLTEVRDLPRHEVVRQIRELNRSLGGAVADKKNSLGAGQQRQVEKALRKLETHELPDPDRFEITLVQLDDKRRELTDKEYRRYEKKLRDGDGGVTATLLVPRLKGQKAGDKKDRKRKKKKLQKRISITTYFKRAPKPGTDVEAMLEERERDDMLAAARAMRPDVLSPNRHGLPRGPPGHLPPPHHVNHGQGSGPNGPLPPPPPPPSAPQQPQYTAGQYTAGHVRLVHEPDRRSTELDESRRGRAKQRQPAGRRTPSGFWEPGPSSEAEDEVASDSNSEGCSYSESETSMMMTSSRGSLSDGRQWRRRRRHQRRYGRSRSRHGHEKEHHHDRRRSASRGHRGGQKGKPSRRMAPPSVPRAPSPVVVVQQHHPQHHQHQPPPLVYPQPALPAVDIQEAYSLGKLRGKAEERQAALMLDEVGMLAQRQQPDAYAAARARYAHVADMRQVDFEDRKRDRDRDGAQERERELERIASVAVARERMRAEEERRAATAEAQARAADAYYRQQLRDEEEGYYSYWRDVQEQEERDQRATRWASYHRDPSPDYNPLLRPGTRRRVTVSYR